MTPSCPLCGAKHPEPFFEDPVRPYLWCGGCDLVFVPPAFHLSAAAEKAQYDLHRNSPEDPGYRRFLSRLADPLIPRLTPGARLLDFGSGPGPTLSVMLEEAGFRVALYDPFYAPDTTVLDESYAAVTATEVVEHLSRPGDTLDRLWARVQPGGILGIMTRFRPEEARFAGWHYRRDPTHVAFFSTRCLQGIATRLGAGLTLMEPDVAIFDKPAVP
ncbi:MAG: class I SAM-dependent methyltransferase [Deltaproteobacteria bacterium]|nr:MAG: class I SAM-dependent methyltransferase [Deltaproteobacteria bacterium]